MIKQLALAAALAVSGNAFADSVVSSPERAPTVASSAALNPATPTWQLVMENRYAIPYGYGYTPIFDFGNRPLHVDAVAAQLFAERGAFCGASLYSIELAFSPTQSIMSRFYADANGVLSIPNTAIYKIGFVFTQPALRGGNCLFRFSAIYASGGGGGGTDQPSGDFELAGVIRYDGGFQDQLALATDSFRKVKAFWVRVPEFCGRIEILEAGTVTEGIYETARLVDRQKMIYEVNGGAGTRLSEVRLSINGPRNVSCDIPVYFQNVQW